MNYVDSFNLFGIEAKQTPCIKGEGVPTTATEGVVGCFYMDTLTGYTYKCISVLDESYTWVAFEGQKGEPGTDGITPHIGDNGNWWIGDTDTGKIAVSLAEGAIVVPTTGDSETSVMSQKAVTQALSKIIETEEQRKIENINIEWSDGYIGTNGECDTSITSLAYSQKIAVQEGDLLYWPNYGESRFVTCYAGETALSEQGKSYYPGEIVIPVGVDGVVVTAYKDRNYTYIVRETFDTITNIKGYKELREDITQLENTTNDVLYTYDAIESNNITSNITWTSGYMSINGGVSDSASYQYSDKIDVSEGDIIYYPNSNYTFRFITAFKNGAVVSVNGTSDVNSYTVPSGIDQIVLSVYMSSYREIFHDKSMKKTNVMPSGVSPSQTGVMQTRGDLNNGDTLVLPLHNVKSHNVLVFAANVNAFDSIEITKESTLKIDSTNIVIGSQTIPHGLTIGRHITVMVQNETSENLSLIRITCDDKEFKHTAAIRFPMNVGHASVKSINSELTDCTLSWTSKNVNAPVWVFGDSYLSFYEERWTYYLVNDGYIKSCLLNGYAGQASSTGFGALVNLLRVGTPNTVVWCLGMNDPDTDTEVNTSWLLHYQKLLSLKEQYGFNLILYTVPTTPTMNNNFKNAIIRESGYRYIDADVALRIDTEGHWIEGALASDNVHPTVVGAKILYNIILSSVPELMCNY